MKKISSVLLFLFFIIFFNSSISSKAVGNIAGTINFDTEYTATINNENYNSYHRGSAPEYKFTIPSSGLITLNYNATVYDMYLDIYTLDTPKSDNRDYIWVARSAPMSRTGQKRFYLTAGNYSISAATNTSTSGYIKYNIHYEQLEETCPERYSTTADPYENSNDRMDYASEIKINSITRGIIADYDTDYYKFYAKSSTDVVIELEYSNIENNGELSAELQYETASENREGLFVNEGKRKYSLDKEGTYYIHIMGSPGSYTLKIEEYKVDVPKTSIKKVKRTDKKAQITVKKQSKATGYQIMYSTSKKFTKGTTKTKKFKTSTFYIKGLKKNKKYFAKVRCYRVVDNKTYYGEYSGIKKSKKNDTIYKIIEPLTIVDKIMKGFSCNRQGSNNIKIYSTKTENVSIA